MRSDSTQPAQIVQFRPEQLQLSSGVPVGSGAISQVVQSTLTSPPISIVVKVLSKIQLLQQSRVESAMCEKDALRRLGPHPFVVRLYGTAQSEDELYFVLEHLPHGDLLQHLRRTAAYRVCAYAAAQEGVGGATLPTVRIPSTSEAVDECPTVVPIPKTSRVLRCLDFNDVQLITAQIIMGLERVFAKGFVLRDLKPENIAFDAKYRACLIDFDTIDLNGTNCKPITNHGVALRSETPRSKRKAATAAKAGDEWAAASDSDHRTRRRLTVSQIQEMRRRSSSFCGTAQYVSPEMVGECRWSYSSDLWALGTIVYEMVYGVHMFSGLSSFEVLRKVVRGLPSTGNVHGATPSHNSLLPFPVLDMAGDCFERLKDFITQLVNTDPHRRLGVNPETHAFDANALRSHALFRDFDWSILDAQVQSFQPRIFAVQGATDNSQATPADVSDPDPSPSLLPFYTKAPHNDPLYADYVYRATADANPFERFMKQIVLNDGEGDNAEHDPPSPTTPAAAGAEPTISSSDDEVDVFDDVGINRMVRSAHEDFCH